MRSNALDYRKGLMCSTLFLIKKRFRVKENILKKKWKGSIYMETPKIFESEYRFCLILWEHEPVKSTELVKLCQEELGWKKATTYTVIKRLAERGVLKSEDAVVTSLVSKEDVQAAEIDELVEKTFEGSLPAFIAAFTKHKKLSAKEVAELRNLIDSYEEE